MAIVVAISFGSTDILGNPTFGWNPSNYDVVLSHTMVSPFAHSIGFAAAATAISLAIGYPTAYTIARYAGRLRHLLLALVLLPWFVDYLVRIYAWIVLFGDNGPINRLLHAVGMGGDPPVTFLNTQGAVIAGLVYSYFPFMVLALYATIERIPAAIIEAGRDLYGTPWQTFRHVTWPASQAGVLAGCVLVFLPAAGDFANAQLLGGPGSPMIGNLIEGQFAGGGYWPYGAAMALVLILLLGLAMVYYLRSAARTALS
jgi:spermidine/putrescine transport system permease protein